MKTKIKLLLLLAGMLPFVIACNNNDSATNGKDTASAEAGHQHSYRCPMNCENGKTYKEPGKCPVCGMALEHFDGEDNGLNYKMQFASNPSDVAVGKAATFSFTPKVVGKESDAVALDVQHEKKIHLIVVSDDLSYFEHIHPDYQSDGSYQIKVLPRGQNYSNGPGKNETRFDNGGNYVMFADYKPTGSTHKVEKVTLKVAGPERQKVSFKDDKLAGTSGAYTVQLNATGGKLVTGAKMHIAGTISQNGKQIDPSTLEDYLGAKAHMVVISLDDKEYLHVHPDVANGKFDLHTTFKKPGIYRGWIQFKAEGKVHTIDFTMNVAQGTAEDAKKATEGHEKSTGDHSNH